LPPFGQ